MRRMEGLEASRERLTGPPGGSAARPERFEPRNRPVPGSAGEVPFAHLPGRVERRMPSPARRDGAVAALAGERAQGSETRGSSLLRFGLRGTRSEYGGLGGYIAGFRASNLQPSATGAVRPPMRKIESSLFSFAVALAGLATGMPATAQDGAVSGNLSSDDQVVMVPLSLRSDRTRVVIDSHSYSGGVDLDGNAVPSGGFDIVIAVYDAAGDLIGCDDDEGLGCETDPDGDIPPDLDASLVLKDLAAGDYTITVSQFDNMPAGQIGGDFFREGSGDFTADLFGDSSGAFWDLRGPGAMNNPRTSLYAFDVRGAGCPDAPLDSCRGIGGKGSAKLRITSEGKVKWKWVGKKLTNGSLGKPHKRTDYSFCVWEDTEDDPSLVLALDVKAKKAWDKTQSGFTYAKKNGNDDGVRKLVLQSGKPGKTKLKTVNGPAVDLPLTGEVTAQVLSADGTCGEARFDDPAQNDAEAYKAKSGS